MRFKEGDLTVGDIGVTISAVADISLAGLNVTFKFIKPSGQAIVRSAVVSGYTATYTTVSGDIDEPGTWRVYLYNATSGYHFTKESGNVFVVRPKPEEMAAYE